MLEDIQFKVWRSHIKIPVIFLVPALMLVSVYVVVYLGANSNYARVFLNDQLGALFGSEVAIEEIAVSPSLHDVDAWGILLAESGQRDTPVITADHVHAEVSLVSLLTRRLAVTTARIERPEVRMHMRADGSMALMRALGLEGDDDEEDDSDGSMPLYIDLAGIEIIDGVYAYTLDEIMEFEVQDVDISKGRVSIDDDNLQMSVGTARAAHADMRFYHELFGFDEADGDWTFDIDDFRIDTWRWSNMAYTAERVTANVDGHTVDMQGQMGFPDSDEVMTYKVDATVTAPLWSPLTQYFVDEYVHYSVPELTLSGEGSLNVVDATGHITSDYLEVYGMGARDIEADIRLHNSLIEITDGVMHGYGGHVDIEHAWLDMLELIYGGEVVAHRIDPAGILADLDVDMSYAAGEASGRLRAVGQVPRDLEYEPLTESMVYAHATERWVEVEMLTDGVLKRANRELLPTQTITIKPGARVWVDLDRVGIEEGVFYFDGDRLDLDTFTLDYNDYELLPTRTRWGAAGSMRFDDLGPYLRHYGVEEVHTGPATVDLRARGILMAPDMEMEATVINPAFGDEFTGGELQAVASLTRGVLDLKKLDLAGEAGATRVRGQLGLFDMPTGIDPEWDMRVYQPRRRQSVRLDIFGEEMLLAAYNALLPEEVAAEGVANIRAAVRGSLDALMACGWASVRGAQVLGEPIARASARATLRDAGVTEVCPFKGMNAEVTEPPAVRTIDLSSARLEHARAGVIEAMGRYSFDDHFSFEASSRGVEIGRLTATEGAGLDGRAAFVVRGDGTLDAPNVSGTMRSPSLRVGSFDLGRLAIAMNTVTETFPGFGPDDPPIVERIVHLDGALLPFITLSAEVPLDQNLPEDQRSPLYGSVGFTRLDMLRLLEETNAWTALAEILARTSDEEVDEPVDIREIQRLVDRVERLRATGKMEVYVPQDFSGFSVLARIEDALIGPGQGVRNERPIAMSYVGEFEGEDRVVIEDLNLGRRGHYLHATGTYIPGASFFDLDVAGALDLSILNSLAEIFPETFPGEFVSSRGSIDIVAIGDDGAIVTQKEGAPAPAINLSGSFDELRATGNFAIAPSEVVLRGFIDPFTVRSGVVALTPGRLQVPSRVPLQGSLLGGDWVFSGLMGLEGLVPTTLDARLDTDNISYNVPKVAKVTLDTALDLKARDLFALDTWRIGGVIEIIDGLFYQDISVFEKAVTGRLLGAFNRRTEVYESSIFEEIPELNDIEFDLDILARDGFRLKNQIERFDLDLEFRIDLELTETLVNPRLTGGVEVLDGVVLFQGERFNVQSGTVRFTGEPTNPRIDVMSVAEITNSCRSTGINEQFDGGLAINGAVTTTEETLEEIYQISLNVRGRPDNLNIGYNSTPYADQRDIISLILTGCTVDLLTASSASQPTLETLLGPLIGRLEREIQEVVAVEEFNIVPGLERTQVRISDNLTRRLSWRFQLDKSFNEVSSTGQTTELEYQLTDRWSAEVSETTYSDLNTASRFQIDLRLKFRLPLD